MVNSVLEVAGLVCMVVAAWLVGTVPGFIASGLGLILIANFGRAE